MENRKYVKLLIPFFILGFFIVNIHNVFAYNVETHAFLTNEIIKFYNQNFPNNSISINLTPYLIDGSRREDDFPRSVNHFYDPVYNRGLSYDPKIDPLYNLGTWQKSKDWAQDSSSQNQLTYKVPAVIASILTALEQGKISALTTETDFTWQEAIKFYANGDKEKAMFLLGHIIHLIEDTSVPDHTRNDSHLEGSPYESYAQKFTLSNPDKKLDARLTSKNPVVLTNLNSYFDGLANYSNNNFYSQDTIGIQSGYQLPEADLSKYEIVNGLYYLLNKDDAGNEYALAVKNSTSDNLITSKFNITIDNGVVKNDYWFRLSTKSVEYGAGVINLFIQQAEAAKNNQNTTKTKSFLSQLIDAISNFFSGIFGSSDNQNFQPAGQISLDSQNSQNSDEPAQTQTQDQTTNQQTTKTAQQPKQTEIQTNQDQTQIDNQDENFQDQQVTFEDSSTNQSQTTPAAPKQCPFTTNQSPSHQGIIINEVAWMGATDDANNEWIELKNISGTAVDISNWQLIDKGEQIKINLASINGSKNIESSQFILLERTDDNSVLDITADLIYTGALSNTDEGLRLFDNQCNLIDEALANPNWPAGNNTSAAERKTMERDASGFNWHTSTIINGTPKKENSISIYSGGGSGGASQSQNTNNQTQQSTATKILINEIQIAPTGNRFIKLYNPNNFPINLTNWYLQRKTQTATSFSSLVSKTYFENKTIGAYGYLLIARDSSLNPDIFLDNLTLTESNSIQLKNSGGDVSDKVGWGQASDCEGSCTVSPASNQSIKRKFQNNTFIDTDNNFQDFEIQTGQSNQAPGAFFVYSPDAPEIGDLINFDASSSVLASNQIISYQWDFGDGTTFSGTTYETNHSYLNPGDYTCRLTIFGNNNLSSTASEIISVASSSIISQEANHIVISEIYPDKTDNNYDFVELYNPTNTAIDLSNYSLKILKEEATSSESLAIFSGEINRQIFAKGFFLIGFDKYNQSSSTSADVSRSYSLPTTKSATIILQNNNNIVDEAQYNPHNLVNGQSLERKAFYNGNCVAAQDSGEFLGNGCGADYFDIRQTPNPQNSLSLPEPRTAPTTPENFTVQYDFSAMKLNFNWQPSQDYSDATSTIKYHINKLSTSDVDNIKTTSTEAKISITEIGRDYSFSIQAFDKDGLESTVATSTISVPSFLSGLYFYADPQDNTKNLIEAYYNQYPFVSDLFGQNKWKLLVFYLNSDAKNNLNNSFWQPNNLTNVLAVKYNICAGGASSKYSLLLPDSVNYCSVDGGAYNSTLAFSQLEDNHFIIQTASSSQDISLSGNDFITVAFYSVQSLPPLDGTAPSFQLVALDKIKYHFGNLPSHQPPQLNGSINLNFYSQSSRLILDWPKATDPDTLDYLLTYEIKYNDADPWQSLNNSTGTSRLVSPGDIFSISLRVKDDFNNYSTSTLTTSWSYSTTNFYITQNFNDGWGATFGPMNWNGFSPTNLQSITPEQNFQFNKVILKIKRVQDRGDSANLNLSLFTSTSSNSQDQPNFNNLISSADISGVIGNPENQDLTFSLPAPIPLTSGVKYWFALEISGFSFNSYDAWVGNAFQNAVSNSDVYLNGDSGQVPLHNYSSYYYLNDQVSINHNQDWYMKIGLGL